MSNIPQIRLGIVAVSRDCFPIELSRKRRDAVVLACKAQKIELDVIPIIIENESDVLSAERELDQRRIDALVVYLGNFGPEGPTTMFIERFPGPAMVCAAAE